MSLLARGRLLLGILGSSVNALRERDSWTSVVIHDSRFAKIPGALAVPILCGHAKDQLRCPENLTIVLMHNYRDEPLAERALKYTGIDNYIVLEPQFEGEWRDSIKLTTIADFLESGKCSTEYLLYMDSRDACLRADPAEGIRLLEETGIECLFSAETQFYGYECIPDTKQWANQNARQHEAPELYINAGVFLGRTEFIRELLRASMQYIHSEELTRSAFQKHLFGGTLCNTLPDYPNGVGSDQQIIRFLHPTFYPRMQCDYDGKLAVLR